MTMRCFMGDPMLMRRGGGGTVFCYLHGTLRTVVHRIGDKADGRTWPGGSGRDGEKE